MFWSEREGCHVRRGEEGNKKKERGIEKEEKVLLDFRCSQENKKSEKTFGQQNQISDVDNWGGLRVLLGKNTTPTFSNVLAFTLIYIYIYIFFAFTII